MGNRDFIENRNIGEENCFIELMHNMDSGFESEINIIDHSVDQSLDPWYYSTP